MDSLLGKNVKYVSNYDGSILQKIPRSLNRDKLDLNDFHGFDIWHCYEVSWINSKGKPEVRIARIIIPASSPYIVESKSLKLYFCSLHQTRFTSEQDVKNIVKKDLDNLLETSVILEFYSIQDLHDTKIMVFEGKLLDELDVNINTYDPDPEILLCDPSKEIVSEKLVSNLFKSNCLVTNQPDFASIQISYTGIKINHESLLQYLISFRDHSGFHEHCVENIFSDIMLKCSPENLVVYAKFTRRGGIDISPARSSEDINIYSLSTGRDVRQ
jgi:7-cyano-7-deazaguanine reductase